MVMEETKFNYQCPNCGLIIDTVRGIENKLHLMRYLIYFYERPPNLKVMDLEDSTQLKRYRDYIVVEVWLGTKRQKEIHEEDCSLISYSIPRELFVE